MPWESAKWDLQNKRCAKYALKKSHPTVMPCSFYIYCYMINDYTSILL